MPVDHPRPHAALAGRAGARAHDRNGLEVLDRRGCLHLLRSVPIGRVALTMGALPVILPVTFVVTDRDEIAFRTGEGQKLRAALDGTVVAFEADAYDRATRSGWSVLVQGQARVLEDPPPAHGEEIDSWVDLGSSVAVVIDTHLISGRRLGDAPVALAG